MKRRRAQAALQSSRAGGDMVAMLLPVSGKHLLLPSVALAEITPMQPVRPVEERPNWMLGEMTWREEVIPVIAFEGINDEPFAPAEVGQQVAVVNGVSDVEQMAFYGIALQSMPRLFRIAEEDVQENPDAVRGVAESMAVFAEGTPALIPDLEYIEQQLLAVL